jgi:hypothetical protein
MRVAMAALAVLLVLGSAYGARRLAAPPSTSAAPPVQASVTPAVKPLPAGTAGFDLSRALPPPPVEAVPSPATPLPIASSSDPFVTVLDRARQPHLRNADMDHLRASREARAIAILHGMATDPAEDEVMRSWAAQHLGLSWSWMNEDQRTRVRATLQAMADAPSTSDLPGREALLALARSDRAAERELAIAAVDAGLADDGAARLDLHVRLAGELGLDRHRARAAALIQHPSPAVAGAARETLTRLSEGEVQP